VNPSAEELPICGVWVDGTGHAHVSLATIDGGRAEAITGFHPFAWLTTEPPETHGVEVKHLKGPGEFRFLALASTTGAYEALARKCGGGDGWDAVRPFESQFLLQRERRMFDKVPFNRLRRCQIDIETAAAGGDHFSDPEVAGDRVLAIGLSFDGRVRILALADDTDDAERALLESFNAELADEDPDTIEGHNLFKFDLDYLRVRAKRLKVPSAWGRFGQKASWRRSRLRVAERWIDFPRCDVPGRSVIDTYLLVQLYDISVREMSSYGLKDSAVYFGITPEDSDERTYIPGAEIQNVFKNDRARFDAYLVDDLRETRGISDLLLPTYYEQTRAFPTTLQEITLRGSAGKLDLLFLEKYYLAGAACPAPGPIEGFEGGFTRSFKEGVFRHVLHFDVASLYPSLLLGMARNPKSDSLGIFIPLLRELRDYRLKFKTLARTAETAELRAEYQARQTSFKILINSFYGYLGFSGARFGDGELASEVTRLGRELLKGLIAEFEASGCEILEADTDGIYLSSEKWHNQPEALLEVVSKTLPPGIDLEFDGTYVSMFCYKAKNYALYDGERVTIRGSALRSRGIEPYLRRLTTALIHNLLGAGGETPAQLVEQYRSAIEARTLPVKELAKSENLGQSPEAYLAMIAAGGKPRRAAAEAALQMRNRPRMGERVTYYILQKRPGENADWQRARPLEQFDPVNAPYDPHYYLEKLNDWITRYGPFISVKPTGVQEELHL
jgi:DNA polymerase I